MPEVSGINVLVFPCGSEIGLEIHAALRHAKDVRLHGASSVDDHGGFVYARHRRIETEARSPDFIEALNALIAEWGIDIVLPAHDDAIPVLATAVAEGRLHARAAVPDAETATVCRDKRLTYARLRHLGCVPAEVDADTGAYPIFAKPAIGQGSQGAERVDDAARHAQLRACGVDYVFSEYLPGQEYTVDCLSDADGRLLHSAARQRGRIKGGISVRTEAAAPDPRFAEIAAAIAAELRLKGAWFFQLRRDRHGTPKLLEVAPRIAGSMALARMQGINHALLGMLAHLGSAFSVLPQQWPLVLDRALTNRYRPRLDYRQVYLDLDDTLIAGGKVNPWLMALLYQWQASGIPVTLLTRHAGDPCQTLAAHHVACSLFAAIIHVTDGSPKSAAMDAAVPALFIDDSYRERRDVHAAFGWPVLDVDAVEQLLDQRA